MLTEQTLSTLNTLKLFGMARGFSERLSHPKTADLSHEEFLGLLVQDEKTYRENLRLKRLLKKAKLKQPAALEDIDYKHPRGLNKQLILELCSAQWITHHRNVLLTGPTGVGKSYIACALGNLAARLGYTVLYLRAPRLFETLLQAKGDGSHLKTLTRLAKVQLLILRCRSVRADRRRKKPRRRHTRLCFHGRRHPDAPVCTSPSTATLCSNRQTNG